MRPVLPVSQALRWQSGQIKADARPVVGPAGHGGELLSQDLRMKPEEGFEEASFLGLSGQLCGKQLTRPLETQNKHQ